MRISDWSSDVCSSDLHHPLRMPDIVLRDYPSHLHINLLPRLQGRGVGRRLIERWLRLAAARSEEHTSELQSLMRISSAVFCLKKKKQPTLATTRITQSTHSQAHSH